MSTPPRRERHFYKKWAPRASESAILPNQGGTRRETGKQNERRAEARAWFSKKMSTARWRERPEGSQVLRLPRGLHLGAEWSGEPPGEA